MLTTNSIYHIFSKVYGPVDLTSRLIFVKIYLTGCFVSMVSMLKKVKKLQNLFIPYSKTLSIKNSPSKKKKPTAVKDRGGGPG